MAGEKTSHHIRIFSTPVCPYCYALRAYLDEKGFQYEDIDVGNNEQAREEMIKKSGQLGVPVIEIDGEIIVGFDKEKINQLLKISEQ